MKNLLAVFIMLWSSFVALQAQVYPIKTKADYKELATLTDFAKMKELIFVNNQPRPEVFLYFALLQGMAKDKLPAWVALSVAKQSVGLNFVPKCKICESTKMAFSHYATYANAKRKDNNAYPNLTAKEADLRHKDIATLTEKYTSELLVLLKFTDDETYKLQELLVVMRKQRMAGLPEKFGSKGCPSCDGATHHKD